MIIFNKKPGKEVCIINLIKRKTIIDRWNKIDHDNIDEIISFLKKESDDLKKKYGNNAAFIPSEICNECVDFVYVFFETTRIKRRGRDPRFADLLYDKIDSSFCDEEGRSVVPFILEVGSANENADLLDPDQNDSQVEECLDREMKQEKIKVAERDLELLLEYVDKIDQKKSFIYYGEKGLDLVSVQSQKPTETEKKELKRLITCFVKEGGAAILRYTDPVMDGSVIVNGFISLNGIVERIHSRDLKKLMERYEPDERKPFYKYQLAFMHIPVRKA